MKSKFCAAVLVIFCAAMVAAPSVSGAKGRKGSHRVGGTNSHGKGSHYVGGAGDRGELRRGSFHAGSQQADQGDADAEIARIAAGGSPLPPASVPYKVMREKRRLTHPTLSEALNDEPFAGSWSCDGERVRLGSGRLMARNRHREYRATKAGPGLYLLAEGSDPLATVQMKPSGIVYTGTEAGIESGKAGVPLSCVRASE